MEIEKQLELEKERNRLLRGQVSDLCCVIRKKKRQVAAYKGHYTRAKGVVEAFKAGQIVSLRQYKKKSLGGL